ncbi:hypothetical protein O181_068544 [Austropuccinia psidii MF-1]|uniref:Uncharacterized protein n=1 Tax=Austropuccinia psidii MF-1 TaxID=1389203 RepID=A0A9Q3EXH9_9BASI|nr:hypothetical protein [Austropuccinia psidii MF-1]
MLTRPHPPPDEAPTAPPSPPSHLHNIPPTLLTILMLAVPSRRSLPSLGSWSAFPTCLRRRLPSLHLYSAHPTCLPCCLPYLQLKCPPNMPPMLHTILTISVPSQHASNAAYHPYACMPARHAPDTACLGYPLTLLQPPQDETMMLPPISTLTTPAAYNFYAPAAPSRYASEATLNPPYA